MSGKAFRCRVGFHDWYRDCALIHSVDRCLLCRAVADRRRAAELDAERERIAPVPAGAPLGDLYAAALDIAVGGRS